MPKLVYTIDVCGEPRTPKFTVPACKALEATRFGHGGDLWNGELWTPDAEAIRAALPPRLRKAGLRSALNFYHGSGSGGYAGKLLPSRSSLLLSRFSRSVYAFPRVIED